MLNKTQLKELVDSTLKDYDLYSPEASMLVYGTIIQESKRGTYLKQRVKNFDYNKHALGIPQIEKKTFLWLQKVYVGKYPELAKVKFKDLEYNLRYAILFCRLRYRIDPNPIPKTLEAQAEYWKRVYNSYKGKGKPEQYIKNYKKYA